jgi:glutathione S-transferase
MTELLGLSYSPWTEKARWALDVRHVPYTYRHYQPLLGEPALRLKLRRFRGNVTVPVLTTDDGKVIGDSAEIARWANERGEGPDLFPAAHDDAIAQWIERSERAMEAGRILSLRRMLEDDEALREMVPRKVREVTGSLATRIARFGIGRTERKYGGAGVDADVLRSKLRGFLDAVRAALRGPTLLGQLTFADIAVAQPLVWLEPPARGLKLGEASRRQWSDPELAREYADLLRWRDALYADHRP